MTLTGWRTSELLSNVAQIDYHSLDAISFALNFGLKPLHLVAVEAIGDILFALAWVYDEIVQNTRRMLRF